MKKKKETAPTTKRSLVNTEQTVIEHSKKESELT